jgi:hypothetical protein
MTQGERVNGNDPDPNPVLDLLIVGAGFGGL